MKSLAMRTPPHIVHLTSVHEPFDNRIFKECRSIAESGYKTTLIVVADCDQRVDGVQIKAVPRAKTRKGRMTRTMWQVFREASRAEGDIYQFHDPELIPVGLLLRAFGRKVIYDVHENVAGQIADKVWIPKLVRGVTARAYDWLDRLTQPLWSAVVTTSEELTRKISRLRQGVTTIQNYAVLDEFTAGAHPATGDGFHVLIDCGGVSPRTSTPALVAALSLLPATLNLKLILAGPIDADARVEELQAQPGWKRVEYQGMVSRPQMIRLMSGAAIALILYRESPNNNDVRSNRFFEALASGLPVIAPCFPHWRKAVDSIGCGLTADPTDPEAIAKAISYLIAHPEQAKEMGRRGQEAALKNFNWTSESAKLLNLYRSLLRDQPATFWSNCPCDSDGDASSTHKQSGSLRTRTP